MMTASPDGIAFKLCFCTIKPFTALPRWRFQRILIPELHGRTRQEIRRAKCTAHLEETEVTATARGVWSEAIEGASEVHFRLVTKR